MNLTRILAATTAAGLALAAVTAVRATADDPSAVATDHVVTDKGPVRGVVTGDRRVFQGIPYAAPPTGDRRWRAPQPAAPWRDVRDATKPGSPCAQGEHPIGRPGVEEDCLFVNVTTPTAAAPPRPVLVWIHGGSFAHGAADQYDAGRLATTGDVVVVTVNYRLGIFGFLAHPALDDGADRSGNFGLQDQQAALRWVRRNAAAFGGDAGNVTVIGESAGGYAVCDHLASPTAKGLFDRAIIHSAACTQRWSPASYAAPRPRQVAERFGLDVAGLLGCGDPATAAACLRNSSLDAGRIMSAVKDELGNDVEYGPVLGGRTLPLHPADALAEGRVNRVPVLHGVNHDEEDGRFGAPEAATGTSMSRTAFEWEVRATYGPSAGAVLRRYSATSYDSPAEALATLTTDDNWSRPAVDTNRLLSRHLPTYAFEFAGQAPWYAGLPQPSFSTGTHHMSELAYLFDLWLFPPLTGQQAKVADQVIGYWVRFARTGNPNPNGAGAPAWAPYANRQYVQQISPDRTGRTDLAAEHNYAFWTTLPR